MRAMWSDEAELHLEKGAVVKGDYAAEALAFWAEHFHRAACRRGLARSFSRWVELHKLQKSSLGEQVLKAESNGSQTHVGTSQRLALQQCFGRGKKSERFGLIRCVLRV